MKGVKVKLCYAEKAKDIIIKNDLFEKNCKINKQNGYIVFPIKEGSDSKAAEQLGKLGASIVEQKFEKFGIITDYKDLLKSKVSEKEFKLLPSAFDNIGDLIIIEIPKKLEKRSKIIGEALLKVHRGIKTVLKKAGSRGGTFRTQKLAVIAGDRKKETAYMENGVKLKLDVEKVYFSPRLGTERKRINGLVKPGEEVLVMFSGCGPYVFNIAKNTEASYVYGIEMNPVGHRYSQENGVANKAWNTHLICGDVKKIIPELYKHIIGLKSADIRDQLAKRLSLKPDIMELHLFEKDLFEGRKKLISTIEALKNKGIDVVLHMPFYSGKTRIDICKADESIFRIIDALGDICREHDIAAIVHPCHNKESTKEDLVENMRRFEKYYDYFYFENIPKAIGGFYDWQGIIEIGKKAGIKNVCIDLSHFYETYRDNRKIKDAILKIKREFNTYFHVNDGIAGGDSVEIGKGKVDFDLLLPLVTKGVAEIRSADEDKATEMLKSYKLLTKFNAKKFDRILMPLPKSAEDFLDVALGASKKGTVIHFYDFLDEKDIPKKAIAKISKACKKAKRKYKLLECVKCGQHSPRTFRICVDFQMLD